MARGKTVTLKGSAAGAYVEMMRAAMRPEKERDELAPWRDMALRVHMLVATDRIDDAARALKARVKP